MTIADISSIQDKARWSLENNIFNCICKFDLTYAEELRYKVFIRREPYFVFAPLPNPTFVIVDFFLTMFNMRIVKMNQLQSGVNLLSVKFKEDRESWDFRVLV